MITYFTIINLQNMFILYYRYLETFDLNHEAWDTILIIIYTLLFMPHLIISVTIIYLKDIADPIVGISKLDDLILVSYF